MKSPVADINRRHLLKAGTGVLAGLAMPMLARPARAQARLNVASLLSEDSPETLIWRRIAEITEERMPGAFSFNIVANAALGGEAEVIQNARLGAVQGSLSTATVMSTWVPELQLLDLPLLFDDAAHLNATTSGPIGDELRQKLEEQGIVSPAFINYGARHLLTKTPIVEPAGLRGVNMRVIQSQLHTRLWANYGANPTGIPIVEVYNALQTGVVDAMDLTKSAYANFKLYEVVPDLTETAHIWAAGTVYYAATFWNSLDAESQGVLRDATVEGAAYFDELIVTGEGRAIEEAKSAGGEVFQRENSEAWLAGARPIWEEMADAVGGMDRIEAVHNRG